MTPSDRRTSRSGRVPAMDLTPHNLRQRLSALPTARRYWVAYSGGRDSHVLLHCARQILSAPTELCAVHVHHGLHVQADDWQQHCAKVCADLGVGLQSVQVDAQAGAGQSPEAAARDARYQAIARLLQPGDALLTAHHRNDQAETVLLQLLRGAGPRGLAAMPACSPLGSGLHLRPLLEFPRQALSDYATRLGLHWVEDLSNLDVRFERNFVRQRLVAVVAERWPAWDATLARAAENSAEAAYLADQLGELDLLQVLGENPGEIDVIALQELDPARQRNVIRTWLRRLRLPTPTRAHLRRILDDVVAARVDAEPLVHWSGVEVRRYRDRLYAMAPLPLHDPKQRMPWDLRAPLVLDALNLRVTARRARGRGVRCDACTSNRVQVAFRSGGEHLRPLGSAHRRSLKTLFQERGVAPWQRDRIPLFYVGEQLAAVGSLWLEQTLAAATDEDGFELLVEPLTGS